MNRLTVSKMNGFSIKFKDFILNNICYLFIKQSVISTINLFIVSLLGGMPIKIIGNSFVTFYTKHLPLEFIGNYDVCETPRKSIGKSFNIQSNYYLRRIFPKRKLLNLKHSVSKGIMPIVCFSLPIDIYSVNHISTKFPCP